MNTNKGFTLIELLVVIAVLGILAAVVLVAINPGERINEANDAGVKNDVSQVATALESYFTNNSGDYTGADATTLVSGGYIKLFPSSTTVSVSATVAVAHGSLSAASASCDVTTGGGANKYWRYDSTDGASEVVCADGPPTAAAPDGT